MTPVLEHLSWLFLIEEGEWYGYNNKINTKRVRRLSKSLGLIPNIYL